MKIMRILAVLGLFSASACETVKGIGRDITRGAEAIDRSL